MATASEVFTYLLLFQQELIILPIHSFEVGSHNNTSGVQMKCATSILVAIKNYKE